MRGRHWTWAAGWALAGCLATAVVALAALGAYAAAPGTAGIALVRRLVSGLSTAPPYAQMALPSEHRILGAMAAAFLLVAAAVEMRARWSAGARRARRAHAGHTLVLDVASAAGHRTAALDRARAHPVEDADGRLVAQIVWSHEQGWCAQASWPHHLYGPTGAESLTARLEPGVWLSVAGVRLTMRAATPNMVAGREPKLMERAL